MILHTQSLVDTLRKKCDHAQKRIWISSPFIGSAKDIYHILGGNWKRSSIDCKILTDIDAGFVKKDSFNDIISAQVPIKSLKSLHAKIYIVDDWCLITSANLTGTAFSCRYEIGTEESNIAEVEKVFSNWWDIAADVTSLAEQPSSDLVAYQDGGTSKFSKKCKLPPYSAVQSGIDKYLAKCDLYNDFAQLYANVTGRNNDMVKDEFTLLMEIDYFFNFLYHNHPKLPTKGIKKAIHRTDAQRKKLIKQYYPSLVKFYKQDEDPLDRVVRANLIHQKLSATNILKLSKKDLEQITGMFHCMQSYPLNRTRFLNPKNNSLKDIVSQWYNLLHSGDVSSAKIKEAQDNLNFFGPSAICELIAWYMPNEYPMMNLNSDSGMRFFGYDV